jgi:hypothetical protein
VNRPSALCSMHALTLRCQSGWAKRTPDGRGGQVPVSKTRPSIGETTDRPSADGRSCMERKGTLTPGPRTPGFVADQRRSWPSLIASAVRMLFWKWSTQGVFGPNRGSSTWIGGSFPSTVKVIPPYRVEPRWTQAVTDFPSGDRLR